MKKLILVFAAIGIVTCSYTQFDSTTRRTNSPDNTNKSLNQDRDLNNNQNQDWQNDQEDKNLQDGVMMKNGKVVKVKNGQTTTLDKDMTFTNGTRVMSDGTCIKKDGTRIMLKEGQQIDMSGNVVTTSTQKDKDMYLVPDSTVKKQ